MLFTGLTLVFLKQFAIGIALTSPLLLSLAILITLLGQYVGRGEGWSRSDSFYWSFITATTVGYGDIRPVRQRSRMIAVVIAFLGLILTGIIIAVAVEATTRALRTELGKGHAGVAGAASNSGFKGAKQVIPVAGTYVISLPAPQQII